jgi:hypothetical protein
MTSLPLSRGSPLARMESNGKENKQGGVIQRRITSAHDTAVAALTSTCDREGVASEEISERGDDDACN